MVTRKTKTPAPRKIADKSIEKMGRENTPWYALPWVRIGYRVTLLLGLTVLTLYFTPGRENWDSFRGFEVGTVAEREVIAPFDFPVIKSEEELSRERAEAASAILPVLVFDPGVQEIAMSEINIYFDRLRAIASDSSYAAGIVIWSKYLLNDNRKQLEKENFEFIPDVIANLKNLNPRINFSDMDAAYLLNREKSALLKSLLKGYIGRRLERGLLGAESARLVDNRGLVLLRGGEEIKLDKGELSYLDQAIADAHDNVVDPEYPELSLNLFIEHLRNFIRPNIFYDSKETERRRTRAAREIRRTRDNSVLKGERIITRGDRITAEQMERLQNMRDRMRARNGGQASTLKRDGGLALLYLSMYLLIGIYLYYYRRENYERLEELIIIALSVSIVLGFAYLIHMNPQLSEYMIPAAIASMMVAYLINDRIAMVVVAILAVVLGIQSSFSIHTVILALLGGAAGAISVRRATSRRGQYLALLYISAGYLVGIFALDFAVDGESARTVLVNSGWAGANAFISTMVVVGLVPLFEYIFKVTSNFSLLELSDLNRPLLKRLALEAPGTYHHSIIMSNLAEAAAAGIGANPIYARVAAYYHDIGKLGKPEYFIENQQGGENPHDKLSPKMSTLIIANHVREGVDLAREAKLPECIIDVIRQHHGSTQIGFFFNKEKENNPGTTLNEQDFCYPGPRPISKEAAIIMLADSIESASRTLSEPTPSRMKGLIKTIIENKLKAGQLDDADLTLKELNRITEEFLTILIGVHHQRIDYPQKQEKGEPGERQAKAPAREPSHSIDSEAPAKVEAVDKESGGRSAEVPENS